MSTIKQSLSQKKKQTTQSVAFQTEPQATVKPSGSNDRKTKLVGANFEPTVTHALKLVAAHPDNVDKTMKDILGEAINDICAKYRVPQPYTPTNS